MLAPMMTPIACDSFISPELTKPIIMTVVAADDCITAVIIAPSTTPLMGLDVAFSSQVSSFPPASFSSEALRVCIPKRNRAIPPSRFSMS